MKIRTIVLFLISVFLSPLIGADSKKGINDFVFVTFDDLAENGNMYDGKNVAVVGYYILKSPDSILYKENPVAGNFHGKMLWIGGSRNENDKNVVRKNASFSLIIGKYSNEKLGIFGKYFGSLDDIFAIYPLDINK